MTEDDEIVEAMARAMCRRNFSTLEDGDIDEMWDGWVEDARAALRAYREMGVVL